MDKQRADERACQAAGGASRRHGVRDHLCAIYSCAERTADAGKPCRTTQVDGGKIVGRVCVE